MKLIQLLEAVGPAGWKKNYEARIDIDASYSHAMKNWYDLDGDEMKAAYKSAKEKFEQLQKAHSTGLLFKTVDDAKEYLKTMEYPNWPIHVENNKGRVVKTRGDKVVSNYKKPGLDDIQVNDLGNGKIEVSVKASKGPIVGVIKLTLAAAFKDKKKAFNKTGREIKNDWRMWDTFKSNTVIIQATKDEVEEYLHQAKDSHKKEEDRKAARAEEKAKEPEIRKQQAEERKAAKKNRLEELIKKYGNTAKMVTLQNEKNGWSVFVKNITETGKDLFKSNLDLSTAEKEQERLISKLQTVLESSNPAIKWCVDHMTNKYAVDYLALNVSGGKICSSKPIALSNMDKLPYPFGKVKDLEIVEMPGFKRLSSFENFPEEANSIYMMGSLISSFKDIHKYIKRCKYLNLYSMSVKNSILGILKIEGLQSIVYHDDKNNIEATKAFQILKKYVGQGSSGIIKAQREMMEADLDEYAEL